MIRIAFSSKDVEMLRYERWHHPHPRVQQKMWALWLKSIGVRHATICQIVDISENTLRSYLREYIKGGVNQLKQLTFFKPESLLSRYQNTIELYFKDNPPTSAAQARDEIYRLTGIKRGLTQTRQFLHHIGFRFRKVGSVPAKADPDSQDAFKKNCWNQG